LCWSVQTWVPGVPAAHDDPGESAAFALDLAELIGGLRAVDAHGRVFAGNGRGSDLRSHDAWLETCFARSAQILDVPRLRPLWAVLRNLRARDPASEGAVQGARFASQ
jgi:aminoglycoside phosphotransferase (APT) family kinase protein